MGPAYAMLRQAGLRFQVFGLMFNFNDKHSTLNLNTQPSTFNSSVISQSFSFYLPSYDNAVIIVFS